MNFEGFLSAVELNTRIPVNNLRRVWGGDLIQLNDEHFQVTTQYQHPILT